MKYLKLIYGLVVYLITLATVLYAIGFVGDMVVPKTIDAPPAEVTWQSWVINLFLLSLFAIQHSVMARPAFKAWWTNIVPRDIERSTYVLFTDLCLIALFAFWQPISGTVWMIEHQFWSTLLTIIYFLGWAIVLISTFQIDHFDLFGVRQVYLQFIGKEYTPPKFIKSGFYKYVRHPLMFGFIIAFWATPHMTVGHLLFAVATFGYIIIAVQLEERDLIKYHGETYQKYKREVSMIFPSIWD